MDFPPVINLVRATFDDMSRLEPSINPTTTAIAPQPVANTPGLDVNQERHSSSDPASIGTSPVGRALDVVA